MAVMLDFFELGALWTTKLWAGLDGCTGLDFRLGLVLILLLILGI